jgi:arsenate reductase-like glutaredoxin family protein
MENLIDEKSKEYENNFVAYATNQADIEEKLLQNPGMFKTPIVRNGKNATVGYSPEVWMSWA